MSLDREYLDFTLNKLNVPYEELLFITHAFQCEMEKHLYNTWLPSSLKMLPAYVALPSSDLTGKFLALDFGGTNVRVALVNLLGDGRCDCLARTNEPLRTDGHDFTSADTTADELFDFIAGIVAETLDGDTATGYRLGHTFSYPSRQDSLHDATLINWTKELAVPGVKGQPVNALLSAALARRGLANVKPVAIVNDTVSTLLAAAYQYGNVRIASIYGTGHNTCYLEPSWRRVIQNEETCEPMVINMESGGFNVIRMTKVDDWLNEASEFPGLQRLEKMSSGRYLGQLFSLALGRLMYAEVAPNLTAEDLSRIVEDYGAAEDVCNELFPLTVSTEVIDAVQELGRAIVRRSGRLVAATYVGLLRHLAVAGHVGLQRIAVEGSVYENCALIRSSLREALDELLGREAHQVEVVTVHDGALVGSAIAAALAY